MEHQLMMKSHRGPCLDPNAFFAKVVDLLALSGDDSLFDGLALVRVVIQGPLLSICQNPQS